uniref:Uracil phosphoribosyltransferase n=1 Tax=Neoizziella asiatica TaxID=1077397 RepID=A0A1G4NXP9_9FLOR|nr:Uracil phosphoribosyltransferase [Neoizziella asiatica]SCW23286.1 Uracil phosphoribosyltransferase [Neoizziella asiatica]
MPINIYAVKHPLVLNWTNHLIHNNQSQYDQQELIHKISLSLIYEACRNTIHSQTLYLKYLNQMEKVWLIENQPIDLLCSDIQILQIISKDVKTLIPAVKIHPILAEKQKNQWQITSAYINRLALQKSKHIIIIEHELLADKIRTILSHIYDQNTINPQITICCNKCNSIELDNLGQKYIDVNIYTSYLVNTETNHIHN